MTSHDPLAAVRTAASAHRRDVARAEASRADLIEAIVAALNAGTSPGEVTDASGWTGAQVRKVARQHGIVATDRYQRATHSARKTAAAKLSEKPAD